MALCLNMYNSEHKGHLTPMSPRISFSNDFVDAQLALRQELRTSSREAPVSSDFEFSGVTNHSMMTADELFFKGRMLPYRDNFNTQMQRTTTLREELLVKDHGDGVSFRQPKISTRWKGLLGLKRTHMGSKKDPEKSSEGSSGDVFRRSGLVYQEANVDNTSSTSQELLNEGDSTCRDVKI